MNTQLQLPDELKFLLEIVPTERISTGESILELHSKDESFHTPHKPAVVVYPLTTAEVSKILKKANELKIPVTPWGAGTSLEGNPIPVYGGIVLDMQQMNRIKEVCEKDLLVVVEPGVIYKELNKYLSRYGLFFPPDPGAAATIGGMVANNASGIRSVKYGATRDLTLGLEVVLPTGEIIRTGTRAAKSSSGYDLTRLFVGSEGTLGVFTEITLKLVGIPEEYVTCLATFDSVEEATEAVCLAMQSGVSPAALEFLDAPVITILNKDKGLTLEEKPTIFAELQGSSKEAVERDLEFLKEIFTASNCTNFNAGITPEERAKLWETRHDVHECLRRAHPEQTSIILDTAVPISHYSEMVRKAQQILASRGLTGFIFGHAGSGNLHLEVFSSLEDKERWQLIFLCNDEIVEFALSVGGTATGEHGVGIGKRKFMRREHGDTAYELMKKIKLLIDPNNIMNPGKIFE